MSRFEISKKKIRLFETAKVDDPLKYFLCAPRRVILFPIDAITILISTWHFSYAEHGKLTIEVKIRIFPNFPVTCVRKCILSHRLIIGRRIDHFCCLMPRPQNRISRAGIKEKRSVKVAPPHRKFTVYYSLEFWAFFGHR